MSNVSMYEEKFPNFLEHFNLFKKKEFWFILLEILIKCDLTDS